MTQHKHFKKLVRERMKQSGQRYAAARRFVLNTVPVERSPHRPGLVPGSTALRVLLANRGIDYSEPMAFGLAGGVGIGQFSFYYEKADFASFFVAGRHCWHDHVTYLKRGLARLNQSPVIKESSTPKAAEKALREMIEAYGPCVAWVDLASLSHRGLGHWKETGGGYHIITVYSLNGDTALIGDLTDEPIEIALADLTAARGRIKKDKYRLLGIEKGGQPGDLRPLIKDALAACHRGLTGADGVKSARKNFSLDALVTWADRLTSTTDKDCWARVFAPGHRFFNGLMFLHLFSEHTGSGGGLSRPIMAEFLFEAAKELRDPTLKSLGERYAKLGEQWSELADSALPDDVPLLADVKKQLTDYSESFHSDGSTADRSVYWQTILDRERQARQKFPLTPAECADLRARLRERVLEIHLAEVAAHEELIRIME
jgi:hypothetical protein